MSSPPSPPPTSSPRQLPKSLVTVPMFKGLVWAGFALCFIAYSFRVYVRFAVFRKLLLDDYFTLVAILILCMGAAAAQITIQYLYTMVAVGSGAQQPGPTFIDDSAQALLALSISTVGYIAGVYIVKISFLIFFYRLGSHFKWYRSFWYFVLFLALACCAATFGIQLWGCMFVPIRHFIAECNSIDYWDALYTRSKISCALDVATDIFILCLPVSILWRVQISLRKKLILVGVFALVLVTISVTIARGSIFKYVTKPTPQGDIRVRAMNPAWYWFWYHIEFVTAILIACIVSFRALFTQGPTPEKQKLKEKKRREKEERRRAASGFGGSGGSAAPLAPGAPGSGGSSGMSSFRKVEGGMRGFHESVLDTCRTMEGTGSDDSDKEPVPMGTFDPLHRESWVQKTEGWQNGPDELQVKEAKADQGQEDSSIEQAKAVHIDLA